MFEMDISKSKKRSWIPNVLEKGVPGQIPGTAIPLFENRAVWIQGRKSMFDN